MTPGLPQRAPEPVASDAPPLTSQGGEVRSGGLDDVSMTALISFFKLLDSWDEEANCNAEIV